MIKYNVFILAGLCALASCEEKKEVQLARSNVSLVTEVLDHSPIYFEDRETSDRAVFNRANLVSNTNWIFSIPRATPLKEVMKEVEKLKAKKYVEKMHQDQKEVYYSYADTLAKRLAFFPFSKINYQFEKPESLEKLVYFDHQGELSFEGKPLEERDLVELISQLPAESLHLGFSNNLSFESYLQHKIFFASQPELQAKFTTTDWIY